MRAVEIDDVSVRFATGEKDSDGVLALDRVTVDIEEGEFVSLIGPSGCGKTTLLRSIAGLVEPTGGAIRIKGGTVDEARRGRQIGFVFQQASLLEWRSAVDNVRLPLEISGLGKREGRERALAALETVGLADAAKRLPRELSGGMQQRVAIARALVTEPAVMLMDEPFGALDAITRDKLNLELLRVVEGTGVTVVFVTHSISEAALLSDRVLFFSPRPGRLIEDKLVDIARPRSLAIRERAEFHALVAEGHTLLESGFAQEVGA
jgi:NitT/TauT family transport system ATP-binding protein